MNAKIVEWFDDFGNLRRSEIVTDGPKYIVIVENDKPRVLETEARLRNKNGETVVYAFSCN